MAPRTSEMDPSSHQMEIPKSQELFEHCKLCALLDHYRKFDQNFDLSILKGMEIQELQAFVSDKRHTIPGLAAQQRPIIREFLECSDDLHVEGFVTHGHDEAQSEVAVFSTQSSSRFIVVYRGTSEQQLKPVDGKNKRTSTKLTKDTPVSIYPAFRDAYFELETHVYGLLEKLVDENPFCEVVFTGHSHGAALATIGAVRFAIARPMLRFSCHAFGSPKVGLHDFRQLVNALPNLKVFRVEYGADPNTGAPTDTGPCKWEHVGHTLVMHATSNHRDDGKKEPVTAYRFDCKKPAPPVKLIQAIRKQDSNIDAYVQAMEPFTLCLKWVSVFEGENVGRGIRGKDNEKRQMV